MVSRVRRTAIAGIGLAASLVVAGCAGSSGGGDTGSGGSGEAGSGKTSESPAPQASGGPEITNPKDAAAVDVCSLLPADAAAKLGVKPEGEKQSNRLNPELSASCAWRSSDGAQFLSLAAFEGRSIQVYYENEDAYLDFKKLTVSGYPAVRANKDDPMTGGACSLFMAVKKNQVVGVNARTPEVGKVDPCEIGKKALRLSLPSWPAK